MSWKLFGKSITKEIAINSTKWGKENLEVEESFDIYFLGIRISSGNKKRRSLKTALNDSNHNVELINFNSIYCDVKLLPGQKVFMKKELKSDWYKWTCNKGTGNGIAQTEKEAHNQGKKYCGAKNYLISRVLVTKMQVQYDEVFF
jgi:hypothetical protein